MINWLQIETCNTCGAGCTMCPLGLNLFKKREPMDSKLINRIVTDIVPHVRYTVYPFQYNEPFKEPRLLSILRLIKGTNKAVEVHLNTTLQWDDPVILDYIFKENLVDRWLISFYGPDRETMKKYQPGLDYSDMWERVTALLEAKVKAGDTRKTIVFEMITTPDLLTKMGYFESTAKTVCGHYGVTPLFEPVPYDTFHGHVKAFTNAYPFITSRPPTTCFRPFFGMNILATGEVVPCCSDFQGENVMGNLNDTPWLDIWEGPKFKEFRKLHREGRIKEIPMCKQCCVPYWGKV